MFGRGRSLSNGVGLGFRNSLFSLPGSHGDTTDSSIVPLGSGIVMLLGMGGAYLVAKKRRRM